jgi:hypothetical protein
VPVLLPLDAQAAYDLVVEVPRGVFVRVQCKAGRLVDGCVSFNSCSTDHGRGRQSYVGRADVFAVHCAALGRSFAVPVADAASFATRLRLRPPANNQRRLVRLAEDHTLARWVAEQERSAAEAA